MKAVKASKDSQTTSSRIQLDGLIILLSAMASLTACSSASSARNLVDQAQCATKVDELQKLKSAEYQDYMTAMTFEETNLRFGNYYAAKGFQVHELIGQLEEGQHVNDVEITRALDDSGSAQFDERAPGPFD